MTESTENTEDTPVELTDEQKSMLATLAGAVSKKQLRKMAKGLNRTQEGRESSGKKYWNQKLLFKAMCIEVLAGADHEEVVAKYEAQADSAREEGKEAARAEMGSAASFFEQIG